MTEIKKYKKQPSVKLKKQWVELYYKKNATVKAIAADYDYPIHTVYRVLRRMDPHRKERNDKGKKRVTATLDIDLDALSFQGESAETQLELFIQETLRAISKKKKMKAEQALHYANRLMDALKKLRGLQFANITKSLDVEIVEAIIRRYEPEATELRVIEIFKEESARIRARKHA